MMALTREALVTGTLTPVEAQQSSLSVSRRPGTVGSGTEGACPGGDRHPRGPKEANGRAP
jgi:hypothetical protein